MFALSHSEPIALYSDVKTYCIEPAASACTYSGPILSINMLFFLQVLEEFRRTCQALSEKLGNNNFFINDR